MPSLLKSLRKSTEYSQGGVLGVLAIPTLLANGARGFEVTRTGDEATNLVPAAGNAFQLIEPEENSCGFAETLKVGATRYLNQSVSFKYGTLSNLSAVAMKALNLGRHSFLLKLKNGTCVLLGENNGLTAEKNDGGAGASNDDLAGNDLTLSGGEIVHAALFPASVFDALAAGVTD
ncbi:hypothetical protein [Hymenobacter sp.]|uniref:hypothetical protein n=1 Tax=Hymenobacter sp. TaxID=1898978 RepID=UPI00286AC116|nr:hypothetical protein [Hymenobacter sp.]